MARIKIKDLPKDIKISKEELKLIHGGPTRRGDIDKIGLFTTLESQSTKETDGIFIIDIDS